MNSRLEKIIRTGLLLLPVFLIGVVLYINFYYGYVVLEASDPGYEASIDGQLYLSPQHLRVRPGKYQVELRGPRAESQTMSVSVGLRSEVTAKPTNPQLTDEQIVGQVLSTDSTYTIYGITFFEKDYWFVAFVGAPDQDTLVIVGRYLEGTWSTAESGTLITGEDIPDAPDSVKQFLDGEVSSDDSL